MSNHKTLKYRFVQVIGTHLVYLTHFPDLISESGWLYQESSGNNTHYTVANVPVHTAARLEAIGDEKNIKEILSLS